MRNKLAMGTIESQGTSVSEQQQSLTDDIAPQNQPSNQTPQESATTPQVNDTHHPASNSSERKSVATDTEHRALLDITTSPDSSFQLQDDKMEC